MIEVALLHIEMNLLAEMHCKGCLNDYGNEDGGEWERSERATPSPAQINL